MRLKLGIQVLIGLMAIGGIASAIFASPILYAAGDPKQPYGGGAVAPQASAPQPVKTEAFALDVKGIKSASDSDMIKKELKANPAILSTNCNQASGVCNVAINPERIKKEDVAVMINKLGFQAYLK
jgi:hypothetical protein